MPALQFELFGGFELCLAAGDVVRLPTRKSRALLAYLAIPPGQLHSREELATLLWGERAEKQARHSLSQELSSIRKALIIRDRPCRYRGCERPHRWCDAHHVEHWVDGGSTSLDNLVLLCRRHHRAVHEGGVRLPPLE